MAREFIASTGANSPQMFWDESFASWNYYGVRNQPFTVVLDGSGAERARFSGAFDGTEVLNSLGL